MWALQGRRDKPTPKVFYVAYNLQRAYDAMSMMQLVVF
jgi:hypothetical protein